MDELSIVDNIKNMIFTIRGQRVMIDRDLANLYEVDIKSLNRAVKRNIEDIYRQLDYLTDKTKPHKIGF